MARIRTVKPKLFTHEALYDAEHESGLPLRLAYIGLFTEADREGRFQWRPRTLKAAILPFDDLDFSCVLDALERDGFIARYVASNGDELGVIPTFRNHQAINAKEPQSQLEAPDEALMNQLLAHAYSTREPRVSHARLPKHMTSRAEGKGKEGNGKEQNLKPEGANDDNGQPRVRARGSGAVSSSPALRVAADDADAIARASVSVQRARQAIADAVVADLRDHGVQRVAAAREPIAYAVNAGATLDLFAEARKVGARSKGEAPVTANFVLGIVRNWLAEGHTPRGANGHTKPLTPVQQREAERARVIHGLTGVRSPAYDEPPHAVTIDMPSTERDDDPQRS